MDFIYLKKRICLVVWGKNFITLFSNLQGMCWTEMVRAGPIAQNQKSNLLLIDTYDTDVPTGVQLLTKSPEELHACLLKIEELALNTEEYKHLQNIVAVDLNFGVRDDHSAQSSQRGVTHSM